MQTNVWDLGPSLPTLGPDRFALVSVWFLDGINLGECHMKTIMFLTAGAFFALFLSVPAMAGVTANGLYVLKAVQIHSLD